jgi:hypothetical protein
MCRLAEIRASISTGVSLRLSCPRRDFLSRKWGVESETGVKMTGSGELIWMRFREFSQFHNGYRLHGIRTVRGCVIRFLVPLVRWLSFDGFDGLRYDIWIAVAGLVFGAFCRTVGSMVR